MDDLGGRYIWYTSLIMGSLAAVAFLLLGWFVPSPAGISEGTGLAESRVADEFVSE
jgi:hypothetical protein